MNTLYPKCMKKDIYNVTTNTNILKCTKAKSKDCSNLFKNDKQY